MFSAKPALSRQEDAPRYYGVTTLNPCRCCECPNWERHGCHCPPNNNVTQDDINQYLAFERRRMARRALDPEWQAVDPIENGRPCIEPGCPPRSLSQCGARSGPYATGGEALGCCGDVFDPDHPCCEACAEAHKVPAHNQAASFHTRSFKLNYPYKTLSTLQKPQSAQKVSKSASYSVNLDTSPTELYKSACSARKSYVFKTPHNDETNGRFVCMTGRPLVYCTNKYVPSLDAHVQCLPPQFQGHLRTSGHYMCYIDPAARSRDSFSGQRETPEIRSAKAYQNKVRNMQKDNNRRLTVLNDLEARLREGGDAFQNTHLPGKGKALKMLTNPSEMLNVDALESNKFYLQQEKDISLADSCTKRRAGIGIGDGTHDCRIYSRIGK
ncbi:Hypothetical protein GSB_153295 [Giardia duodenalis]|uniref:Uncharacterized protein n=2 Tax=Giardia intestinalis TaxID=5741 RepID=C6LXA9_GIAIB|nr:Hypothetical protein GL50581_3425 [Giardia intestinalis ATCC 50581]ESU44892.1 Hypothetical protein GSB_153295 [Giardia intestinalis]